MTATTWNASNDVGTTTKLRAYGSAMHAAMLAAGFIQTADTGQVDWTTAAYGFGSYVEVWRFNDTLQATRPLFIILSYMNTGDTMYLRWNICTATNGASAVGTGAVQTGQFTGYSSAGGSVSPAQPFYLSGDGSSLTFVAMFNPVTSFCGNQTLVFSRSQDDSGAYTGDGMWVQNFQSHAAPQGYCISFVGSASNTFTGDWFAHGLGMTSGVVGTDITLLPAIITLPKVCGIPNIAYAYYVNDISTGSQVSVGGHNYIALGQHAYNVAQANSYVGVLMRFE